jgi:hypothetical protein
MGLRDVESILFSFRRPGNDAAGIVALGAESAPANRQNQSGHKEWALSHAAPPVLKFTSRVDVKVLPRATPALVQTPHKRWQDVIGRISPARELIKRFGGELRQTRGELVLILSTRSPKNSPVSTA